MSDDNIKKPKDSEKREGKVESNLKIGEVVNNENESIEINKFNDLKLKQDLSEDEKLLIKNMFKNELPLDIIFDTLAIQSNLDKQEKVRNFFSLKKPIKPFPQNAEKIIILNIKTLPWFKYPSQYFSSKKYYTFIVIGEYGSGKTTLLDTLLII